VRAFDARHVEEARAIADQNAAGKGELRHRLPAAFRNRARAVRQALAAFEHMRDRRMRFKALELVERRQGRIRVIQMHDKADVNLVVLGVI
jgi:hypothetical protein